MGKITAVFETDDCNCKCNHSEDYIPTAYPECETVDMKLDFFKREIDSIDIDATAEVENDGGDPAVIVTKTGDNHLKPTFDFAFKNVIGRQGEQGEDGFSPIISVTDITGGHRVSITDAEGTETFDVMDGQDGQNGQDGQDGQSATIQVGTVTTGAAGSDASVTNSGTSSAAVFDFTIPRGNTGESGQDGNDGFSPVITVTDITGGHRVSITDATGTQTFDVLDGEGRVPAITASASVDANVGTPSVTVTKTGTDSAPNFAFAFSNLKGQSGQNGQDGSDGISPTVSVTDITGGHRVSITDSTGTETFDVMDGQDGQDGQNGYSPVVSITDITGGHRVSITDSTGTETFDVMDGQSGQNGQDGYSPEVTISNITGGHRVTITDEDHPSGQSFDVMDGQSGQNGQDGYSPEVTISNITGGYRVTITDKDHPSGQSFDVMDGQDGQNGQNGQDGQAATIQVGTVSTGAAGSSASVTNSGTSSAAVFDFVIPRGETGAAGQNGQNGQDGVTPVISATATVGSNTGTPSVSVTKSGTDAAPSFAFAFDGLKGEGGGNDEYWNVIRDLAIFDSNNNSLNLYVRKVEGEASDDVYIGVLLGNGNLRSNRYTPNVESDSVTISKYATNVVSVADGIARSLLLPNNMDNPTAATWSYDGTTTLANATLTACLEAAFTDLGIDFTDYDAVYSTNKRNIIDACVDAGLSSTPQAFMSYSDYRTPVYYDYITVVNVRSGFANCEVTWYFPNSECTSSTYIFAGLSPYMPIFGFLGMKS